MNKTLLSGALCLLALLPISIFAGGACVEAHISISNYSDNTYTIKYPDPEHGKWLQNPEKITPGHRAALIGVSNTIGGLTASGFEGKVNIHKMKGAYETKSPICSIKIDFPYSSSSITSGTSKFTLTSNCAHHHIIKVSDSKGVSCFRGNDKKKHGLLKLDITK